MHYAFLMQLPDCDDDLCSVKLYNIFRETLVLLKDLVQFPAIDERHNKVETRLRLE